VTGVAGGLLDHVRHDPARTDEFVGVRAVVPADRGRGEIAADRRHWSRSDAMAGAASSPGVWSSSGQDSGSADPFSSSTRPAPS
jgi:hypothetical protein